jgi:hypothetical protein
MPRQGQKSKDPVQQRLREHKRHWSDSTSEFIAKLIAFKRGLNGRGDAQAGIPPSSIKEALPGEVGGILDQLASQFQGLVQDAGSIMDEQAHYAKIRRRRRNKPKTAPTPFSGENVAPMPAEPQVAAPPANDNVVETLSRLGSQNNQIDKEATSRLSRMWQYVKAPFSNKEYNKYRIGMLSLSADLYYSFLDFENDILSLSINSIPRSVKKHQMARYNYEELKGTLNNLLEVMAHKSGTKPGKAEQTPAPPPVHMPAVKDIKEIEKNLHVVLNAGLAQNQILSMNELINTYEEEEDPNMKSMLADRIRQHYQELIKAIINDVQKKFGPQQINSLQDVINLIRKNQVSASDFANNEIIKVAHSTITRYLKRQLVKVLGYNKTAVHRLEIAEIIDETKNLLKRMMNELQAGLNVDDLQKEVAELEDNMKRIQGPLAVLATMYKEEYYKSDKKKKRKTKLKDTPDMDEDEFMDYLLKRKVRRDLSQDIF